MNTITITYTINWLIDFAPHYAFSGKQCINLRTAKLIKQIMVGGSIGYCINGKFHSLKYLRGHLIKNKKSISPF